MSSIQNDQFHIRLEMLRVFYKRPLVVLGADVRSLEETKRAKIVISGLPR